MKTINYVTNLALKNYSGGGGGINMLAYKELKKYFNINYVGPINPSINYLSKIISKLKRITFSKGNYYYFSESRLQEIADQTEDEIKANNSDYTFYHGPTSWIKTRNKLPYFVYMDACFATYVKIYNNPKEFNSKDLNRIYRQEKRFLSNASKVFFRSK